MLGEILARTDMSQTLLTQWQAPEVRMDKRHSSMHLLTGLPGKLAQACEVDISLSSLEGRKGRSA